MKKWRKLNHLLTALLVVLVLVSGFLIYQDMAERRRNQRLQDAMRDIYTAVTPTPSAPVETTPEPTLEPEVTSVPSPSPTPGIMPQFEDLLAINSDVIGWIRIPETRIDYPVVQTEDNRHYLDHDIYGESSVAGTIFMDYRMQLDDTDRHQILYGHHMRDGSMFTDLIEYKEESFFYENRLIHFDRLRESQVWEIFSAYVTSTDFYFIETNFADDQQWLEFKNLVQEKSQFATDVELLPDEPMLTLSTCTYEFEDARFVVHARLLSPEEVQQLNTHADEQDEEDEDENEA